MASSVRGSSEVGDLRKRLGELTADAMREMGEESRRAYQEKDTRRGIWYPLDYAKALKETGQEQRYEALREKGDLVVGHMSEEFFEPAFEQPSFGISKRRDWAFLVKKEKLPSDALKAAMLGPTILDCGAVCQLACYAALLGVLGEAKFNRLFSEPHGMRMNTDYEDKPDQPMQYFVKFSEAAIKVAKWCSGGKRPEDFPSRFNARLVKVGQLVNFQGVRDYKAKHPSGMGANYNVICLTDKFGSQRYVGHGLSSAGETEGEICARLVRDYNADPDFYTRVPSWGKEAIGRVEQRARRFRENKIPANDPASKVGGFDLGSPQEFDVELIAGLARLPLKQVSMSYVRTEARR